MTGASIEKLDGKSMDIVEQNIEQLKQLFPEVFTESANNADVNRPGFTGECLV